jgi:radical SAM-linked protein
MVRHRVRIRFRKQGDLRWIGHRDLMRCLERLFRRAGLPLGMSEGFHPKPRMTFPSALAVGIAATDEVMELELSEPLSADEVLARIAPHAPPGLEFASVAVLPPGSPKAHVSAVCYEVPVPPAECAALPERIARVLAADTVPVRRAHKDRTVDLRAALADLSLRQGVLHARLRGDAAGPRDVLAALGLGDLERRGACIVRTAVEVAP